MIVSFARAGQEVGQHPEEAVPQLLAAGELTAAAMARNRTIAERLGCLDAEGMERMRRGKSPTVKFGPYAGDKLTVDHIIPRAITPSLDRVLANLELMPHSLNIRKGAKVGQRQIDLANKLHHAGLLSETDYSAVQARKTLGYERPTDTIAQRRWVAAATKQAARTS